MLKLQPYFNSFGRVVYVRDKANGQDSWRSITVSRTILVVGVKAIAFSTKLLFSVWNQVRLFQFLYRSFLRLFFGGSSVGTSQTQWA